ncbi:MAG: hypothetical protein GY727_15200 [Gammaproteobacteria bacterium]|nr:hypothetical protein [Gammaproteobacteria bacterium]
MPKDPQVFADDIELFLLLVAASSPSIISLLSKFKKKEEGLFAVAAISVSLIALLTALLVDPVALAEGLIEEGLDVRNQIEDIHPGIAIWAKHPARTVDNPVSNIPATLENIVDRFGTWHAKYQLVYRPVSPEEPNEYIAYLGGIDVNDNRVDPPGHQTNDLFHDVHARLTGPVAADVFSSFAERYDFDRSREGGATTLAIDTPLASDLLVQDNKHIVQIGRTYFKPSSSVSSDPFPFAPEGEVSINDSLIRAIESARQYIYIEDQYFTPNDSSAEDESKRTIYDALLSAKDHCERLLIIGPDGGGGQPFGEDRRRFLLKELAAQWGSHFAAGVPMRRPLLNNSGTTASKGRCILSEGIDDSNDDKIKLKPPSRVPGPGRFWLWINGELMLGTNVVKYTDHAEVEVIRSSGSQGRWGVKPRKHPPGAAVTLAQLRGIFVHTKAVIVDDVFVSIGSANLNRRGLFHDGEIAALCVPERLKSSTDNPALILRTSLWAEHLGLPPGMGMTLLRDPIAAFDLFFRSRYGGNRFVPMEDLDFSGLFGISPTDNPILSAALVKLGFIGPTATALEFIVGLKKIWHSIIDPTTGDDPSPSSGPIDFDE